jgi:hypothetical protein
MPPAIPEQAPAPAPSPADPQPTDAQPGDPQPTDAAPADPQPGGEVEPNTAVGEQVTVDDGAGDTWSFAVTGVEENPPMEGGSPEAGTRFVAVLFDGQRVEGSFAFIDLFEISAIGTDGNAYLWSDTIQVTAEDDIFYVEGDSFTGARAVIQLPEGVDVDAVVVSSAYGQGVEDTVVDLP